MNEFDVRLRERLARLEAAAPVARWSETEASSGRQRGRRRRRRLGVFLGVAALLVFAGAATAQRIIYPDVPEPELEAALQEIWTDAGCVSPIDARESVRRHLDQLGFTDWTISERTGTEDASCASAAVLTSLHEIQLMPGISADIERAQQVIIDGLLAECMNRDEATQFVTSVLTTAGSDPFVVRADPWGPQGGPLDRFDEYRAHVNAGCYVYVGMPTRDGEGRAVHDLWGPWP